MLAAHLVEALTSITAAIAEVTWVFDAGDLSFAVRYARMRFAGSSLYEFQCIFCMLCLQARPVLEPRSQHPPPKALQALSALPTSDLLDGQGVVMGLGPG